ncbi:hypothetical protein M3194_20135 [Paenibacillus glycanilyticus]|uniref:hypothetical protein n=1 Tax=Paenibacillus glycanilyticus TaxID=126569 RepID=UPI00203DE071|nr:hypothetical protein [Paenibacillus glycanilyticus]MCM3629653.1 hypothetical protein [Paenibacillus glycanilyticus]
MLGSLTLWMEVALWVVMGSMAANLLVDLFKSVTGGKFSTDFVLGYLKDMVYYVLPLLLLAGLAAMDVTGWVVLVGYYLGALAVLLKYLMDLKGKL